MNFCRQLPWMGSTLVALAVVAGLGMFYLFTERLLAERLRLDDENRRELAHVAHYLEKREQPLCGPSSTLLGCAIRQEYS